MALAQRVQELSRYRSDFFGRLRAILGNRSDIRIVGDRFVFQSEVFFDTGQAVLKPEGRAEIDKIAAAIVELDQQIPQEIAWVLRVDGHTDVRPLVGQPHQLGPVGVARDRRGAIPDQQGHAAAAAGRRGLRRVPADRSRHHRGSLRAQPPHRAEADGAVSAQAYTLRPYEAADEDAAIELWRRTWQAAYPHIDFAARTDWWRERWRKELVPQATIVVAETDGALVGLRHRRSGERLSRPDRGRAGILGQRTSPALLLDEAKRISPARLDLLVNKDNARAIRFYEKHGFEYAGDDVNPVSGRPVNRMSWRP